MSTHRKSLTNGQKKRLRYMLDNQYTYRAMADYMNVCTDTLKRILVREGMAEFDGAKYAVSPQKSLQKMWNRPCMKCKDDSARPKWQYICDRCKSTTDSSGLPDMWLEFDE
jgi:IS30 family transposase